VVCLVCAVVVLGAGQIGAEEPPVSDDNGTVADSGSDPSAEISAHRWSTRLRIGDGVSLENAHGDLRVRQSGDSGLHYAAVVQKLDAESRDVEFGTERLPGKLKINVTAPPDWNGRVDASARVPAGGLIELSADDGLIEVRTGDNDIVAVSHDGAINIRTAGHIEARSESGDMLVVMLGTDYDDKGAGRIQTTNGNVELWLQAEAQIRLEAAAGGGIEIVDGPEVLERTDETVVASFGSGGALLYVQSQNGTLAVRTLPTDAWRKIDSKEPAD
jgi:DUF4097 and DUF4098 domain-containing protein YvlB